MRWPLAFTLAASAAAWAPAAAAHDCTALAGPHPGGVIITAAQSIVPEPSGWQPDTTSSYRPLPVTVPLCRIEGTIEGNIGFELWLPAPEKWNGRLLGAGVGGDAGVYNYTDMSRRIGEGFATVTTDSGHKSTQARWMADAKARVDYEHRATHLTALAAKALAADYYAKAPDRSYFLGCSGGGRQALKEMQLYAGDYDGVVAGAPGPYMPLISVRMMWFSLLQKKNPAGALTDADWALYERSANAACDGNDGVRDGIVENPLACRFTPAELKCAEGQATACLSPANVAMLTEIVAPMRNETGRIMDHGLLPGVRTRPGPPSPLLRAMWADAVYDDPAWDENSFRRTADLDKANAIMPELRADSTAIAPFIKRGGKALIYQGWQDPSVIAGPTIDYYRELEAAQGGAAELAKSVRLMMVPGMYHCHGGPGADEFGGSGQISTPANPSRDILWAVIDWVEHDRAPDRIVAAKIAHGDVVLTRALCLFPQSAHYDGVGPQDSAASFACRIDPLLATAR
ncbi:tannase/feruloyl esterase family alpha/beta hydrolase [Glacieibacterium megasporae]|uniref:tannase/feruloyl esterase family alpha/beta hydrolase n=1 Tax=Glacieibacterium megasporae TaxID=2835787 RepID=UPI001C1E0AEF|nr:tannase/feruloyl esterase family alpha/beta hydrolase [Polymorphobacter megasporae]UAJ10877.1 tannase/feruloyl esterase family alpha/beta hydrolase [Polymorphobacter megasporae]